MFFTSDYFHRHVGITLMFHLGLLNIVISFYDACLFVALKKGPILIMCMSFCNILMNKHALKPFVFFDLF